MLGRRLPTTEYEWPDPVLLSDNPSAQLIKSAKAGASVKPNEERRILFRTAKDEEPLDEITHNIWSGKQVLLGLSLELDAARKETIEAELRRAGGVNVVYQERNGQGSLAEESGLVDKADIYITRYREGHAFVKVRRVLPRQVIYT
jgi:mediator of DNA damage checkpoint protein 1